MYPNNQDPNQQPYSIDYLNEIAPQNQKPGMSNKLFLLVAGGGLLVAIIVGVLLLTSGGGGPKQQMATLAARLQTLQKVASESQENIKSSELRSINSNLTIFLANANRDIAEPLANNDIDAAKLDKQIVAKENGDELKKKLEDARLNAVFDRQYAREMVYQLETVIALMQKIYNNSHSQSMKDYLVATDKSIQPIKQQLAGFNTATP